MKMKSRFFVPLLGLLAMVLVPMLADVASADRLVTKQLRWLNPNRVGTYNGGDPLPLDTLLATISSTPDTTMPLTLEKPMIPFSPFGAAAAGIGHLFASTGGADSAVVIGFLDFVSTNGTTTTLTVASIVMDQVWSTGYELGPMTVPGGSAVLATNGYTITTGQNVIRFPILASTRSGQAAATVYGTRALAANAWPWNWIGADNIRFRTAATLTGTMTGVKAFFTYLVAD